MGGGGRQRRSSLPHRLLAHDSLNSQFDKLLQLGLQEVSYDFCSRLLQRCWHVRELPAGKLVHQMIITRFDCPREFTFTSNLLIRMYGQCGRLAEAQLVFDALPEPNVFSWTILFSAYARNGDVSRARAVFEAMSLRDPVAWNAMISVYAECGREDRALEVFWRMNSEGVRWTGTTLLSVVSCLAGFRQPGLEQELAESSSAWTIALSNAMITLHSSRGRLSEAIAVFYRLRNRDVITWNAIIAALIRNGCCDRALGTFRLMLLEGVRFDSVTLLMLLESCSDLDDGKLLHRLGIWSGARGDDDPRVSTALISMYGRCGDPVAAKQVFEELFHGDDYDVVSCSAMITGFVRNDMHEAALQLFRSIEVEGVVKPNRITLSAALAACAGLREYHLGELLVEELATTSTSCWSKRDAIDVSGVVIDMYCKCGRIEKAKAVFWRSNRRNPVCWNSMVSGLALNGFEDEAVSLWREMELSGVGGDKATFATILSLWSHSGRLSDAVTCLSRLEDDHGFSPSVEHYGCMVDLLGRLGLVEEAEVMLGEVPWREKKKKKKNSDEVLWLTLLGACSTQLNVQRGTHAAWEVSQVNSERAALYQLLFNIHACGDGASST